MKIAFMIPSRDGVVASAHSLSVMQAQAYCGQKNYEGNVIYVMGNSSIPLARSQLIAEAMAWGADKLVFLDDDISWTPHQLDLLIDFEGPLITGCYAIRPNNQHYEKLTLSVVQNGKRPPQGRMTIVDKAGFGFLRCNRECIETYIEQYDPPKLYDESYSEEVNKWYRDYFHFSYEPLKNGRNKLLTADQTFIRELKKIGYPCFFHSKLTVNHHQGMIAWRPTNRDWSEE